MILWCNVSKGKCKNKKVMAINVFYGFLKRRHFWRYATFSEVAELYASRIFRVAAMYIAGGFTSVYLYKIGYGLSFVILCWACLYLFKAFMTFFSAFLIANVGPKHGTLVSNLLCIPAMLAIGLVPNIGFIGVVIWGIFIGISGAIYQLCYHVDFSKIKNIEHAGKEIAFMNIFEKITMGVSPVIGGLIALWFSPQVVMLLAALLFVVAALPLFGTSEPVRTKQKLSFIDFPWRTVFSSIMAQSGVGFDAAVTSVVWVLFVAVAILPNSGDSIYVYLGILSSVSIIIAILASYAYGKLIDRNHGRYLLRFSVIGNSLVHISRAFTLTIQSVIGVNITNEIATTGQSMAFMRGMFDTADLSGHRIVYLCLSDIVSNIGASLACFIASYSVMCLGDINGFRVVFIMAAIAVLMVNMAHFNLYRK